MKAEKRDLQLAVISDVHLGTYGCHARELFYYLKSINPEILVLNGDIIDIWQFKKSYWPNEHTWIIKQIFSMASRGTKVYYVTGNHDEMLRKFVGFEMGTLKVVNKVVLELDGKKAWIFHGDVFDVTMKYSKWLAKLGGQGYDLLILLNRFVNNILQDLGREKISLSKKVKDSVKTAVKFVDDFEKTAADIGITNGYDYVVCGHIHKPEMRELKNKNGTIEYLNSGDWIENLTGLEYNIGQWSLYHFNEDPIAQALMQEDHPEEEPDNNAILQNLMQEFRIKSA